MNIKDGIKMFVLGDILGNRNGIWKHYYKEFNTNIEIGIIDRFVSDFIMLGGINNISIKEWKPSNSDDFLLVVKTLENGKDKFINNIKKNKFKKSTKYSSDVAMRTMGIGMYFYGEKNRDTLVNICLEFGRLTHDDPIAYLGGVTTACMVAFAIEKIPIEKWCDEILKILNGNLVKKAYEKDNAINSYMTFMMYWYRYIDGKFKKGKVIASPHKYSLNGRSNYYINNFLHDVENLLEIPNSTTIEFVKTSGFSAPIIAFDCLIDCEGVWEKLVFYSILRPGDSDVIGSISACLYGLMYGIENINAKLLEDINILI